MSPDLRARIIELLYQAISHPLGIAVQTTNAGKLRTACYVVMKGDTNFDDIKLTLSPVTPDTELWIRHEQKDEA